VETKEVQYVCMVVQRGGSHQGNSLCNIHSLSFVMTRISGIKVPDNTGFFDMKLHFCIILAWLHTLFLFFILLVRGAHAFIACNASSCYSSLSFAFQNQLLMQDS